jgi:molybdopterin synthase sulfur carrier subunit
VKVEVQLFATLSAYGPGGSRGESLTLEVADGTTVCQMVQFLRIPLEVDHLQFVNGLDAPSDQRLVDGDVLSLFPPLAGG